jgi:hypothetical protein
VDVNILSITHSSAHLHNYSEVGQKDFYSSEVNSIIYDPHSFENLKWMFELADKYRDLNKETCFYNNI